MSEEVFFIFVKVVEPSSLLFTVYFVHYPCLVVEFYADNASLLRVHTLNTFVGVHLLAKHKLYLL